MIVNFKILIRSLLPFHKRTVNRLKWLRVFAAIADSVITWIKSFMAESTRNANITAQVMCLTWHLNNLFDPEQRRIYILHNEGSGQAIGLISEGETYAFKNGLNSSEVPDTYNAIPLEGEEDGAAEASFQVYIDMATMPEGEITAEINKFRMAGTTFTINNFNA